MTGPLYPELAGRVAVVTGGARGLGCAVADELARQGANVVIADLAASTGVDRADVSSPLDLDGLSQKAVERFGGLDFWINNAGIFPYGTMPDIEAEQFEQTFRTNVGGVLFGTQAAARAMRSGGAIVNVASLAARRARRGRAVYSASKAAVEHLTKSAALELAERGIRVNAVAPGYLDTEMAAGLRTDPAAMDRALDGIPLARLGTVDDVVPLVAFLLSDSASYITGATVLVDGGAGVW